jgi:hypothetical protein
MGRETEKEGNRKGYGTDEMIMALVALAIVIKMIWDIGPCRWLKVNTVFVRTCHSMSTADGYTKVETRMKLSESLGFWTLSTVRNSI